MEQLIVFFRAKQLIGHNCHLLVSRVVFLQDHEFLADIYTKAESTYDSIAERIIGLGQPLNLIQVQVSAVEKLKTIPPTYKENSECFNIILTLNKQILQTIETLAKSGISQGTLNLIAGIADELEAENYKLGQRVKK